MKTATWNDLLVDLKLREIADSDFSFLYKLLKGRNPKENISHEEIPSYKQHVKFVKSKPYQKWYIIEKNRKKIGAIYFSKQNEIGIHFLPKISSESIRQTAMQKLIKKNPENPFFRELIGEIYFSKHNYELAIKHQEISIELLNEENDLYYMMIGNYHLANTNESDYHGSIKFLKKSLRLNPKNTYSWYLLAKAYAENNNLPLAEYATAERYYLTGNYKMAHQFTMKSLKNIEKNTTEWYRANDLLHIIDNIQLQDS